MKQNWMKMCNVESYSELGVRNEELGKMRLSECKGSKQKSVKSMKSVRNKKAHTDSTDDTDGTPCEA